MRHRKTVGARLCRAISGIASVGNGNRAAQLRSYKGSSTWRAPSNPG
nr:J124 [uncultured bacterium]